jgi:hypothetical protein
MIHQQKKYHIQIVLFLVQQDIQDQLDHHNQYQEQIMEIYYIGIIRIQHIYYQHMLLQSEIMLVQVIKVNILLLLENKQDNIHKE